MQGLEIRDRSQHPNLQSPISNLYLGIAMLNYIFRRLLTFIPTLLLISFFTFGVGFFGPGDPIRVLMREQWNDEETYQLLRHKYGFDRPFMVQYTDYIWKSAQ